MKRRTFLSPSVLASAPFAAGLSSPRPDLATRIRRLHLRHTWTTVMSSSEHRDTFFVEYSRDGITGTGEGAPIVRYKESAETNRHAVESIRPWLFEQNPAAFVPLMHEVFRRIEGQFAAKAALGIALLDWNAQKLGVPLWRMFGLDPAAAPVTTFSNGIDTAEVIRQKVREAGEFPVLKIKVGLDNDEEVIAAVRSVTRKPLRVDANEGFRSKEEAVAKTTGSKSRASSSSSSPCLPRTSRTGAGFASASTSPSSPTKRAFTLPMCRASRPTSMAST